MMHRFRAVLADIRSRPNAFAAARGMLLRPALAVRYLRRTGSSAWIRTLFDSYEEWAQLVREIGDSPLPRTLQRRLHEAFSGLSGRTVRGNPYVDGTMKAAHAFALYAIVRKRKPAVVLESGVCNGFSTAILLEALRCNGIGRLHSVDMPEIAGDVEGGRQFWAGKGGAVIPPGRRSGWLVSGEHRNRWTLHLGISRQVLPRLLEQLRTVDIFIHDSEHSFENQLFEFQLAWRYLRPGGILAATDINWSRAHLTFRRDCAKDAWTGFVDAGMALLVKP